MPWRTPDLVTTRKEFIRHAISGRYAITELCIAFGISEKTGHKWLGRWKKQGDAALADRSHAAHVPPHQISLSIRREVIALRAKHPTWGPRKLRAVLQRRSPRVSWPAASTIGELLRREGLVGSRRSRRKNTGLPLDTGLSVAAKPNDVWTTDFKGEFRLGSGPYCYPLTVMDAKSRFLIGTTALSSTAAVPVQIVFERHFEEFGLPRIIRSDNGIPFASARSIGRLSTLSAWWIRLGIRPERIEPAHPQQNGQHERMHKTLKSEATRPPGATLFEQQDLFDRFRREYNDDRPHESLDQQTPASQYTKSSRAFRSSAPELEYPPHFERRIVCGNGMISFGGRRFYLSMALIGQEIGFEETDDGLWEMSYGPLLLGNYDVVSNTYADDVRWLSGKPREDDDEHS